MRIEINQRVLQRNRRIAQYTFFASMVIWLSALGMTLYPAFSNRPIPAQYTRLVEIVPTFILPIGLVLALFAVHMTNMWIREPRPEQAIRDGLKGISGKSVLYHYHHSPAKHVLIAPQGVYVMIVRFQNGNIVVDGERWRLQRGFFARLVSTFRLDGLGDPNFEAERAVGYIRRILEPIAPDLEIQPLVILTDPRAALEIVNEPVIPVVYADEKQKPNLKKFMRDRGKGKSSDMPLTDDQIAAFEEATLPASD